jgi:hypothetical protein
MEFLSGERCQSTIHAVTSHRVPEASGWTFADMGSTDPPGPLQSLTAGLLHRDHRYAGRGGVFRGFVFNGLRARMDWWRASVLDGALFAGAYLDPLFLLLARGRTPWPEMIVHFLASLFAVIIALIWF